MDNVTKLSCATMIPTLGVSVLVILIACLAILTNASVIVVSIAMNKKRNTIASIFVVSLCCVDLVATVPLLWFTISSTLSPTSELSQTWCQVLGGIQEFCKTASVLTIAVITVETFMYIKYPLRHQVCMTLQKKVACLFVIFVISSVVQVIMHGFGLGQYVMAHSIFTFSVAWSSPLLERYLAFIKGIILFLLPLIMIAVIYSVLYRVAKKAMLQVELLPNPLLSRGPSASSTLRNQSAMFIVHVPNQDVTTGIKEQSLQTVESEGNNAHICSNRNVNTSGVSNARYQRISSEPDTRTLERLSKTLGPQVSIGDKKINRKACVVLTFRLCYFIIIWLPINVLDITKAFDRIGILEDFDSYYNFEIVSCLLVLTSYATNPGVYGLMSKAFREESIEVIKKCCCTDKNAVNPFSIDPEDDSNEDFFQFLRRTPGSIMALNDNTNNADCNSDNILLNAVA